MPGTSVRRPLTGGIIVIAQDHALQNPPFLTPNARTRLVQRGSAHLPASVNSNRPWDGTPDWRMATEGRRLPTPWLMIRDDVNGALSIRARMLNAAFGLLAGRRSPQPDLILSLFAMCAAVKEPFDRDVSSWTSCTSFISSFGSFLFPASCLLCRLAFMFSSRLLV